MRTRREMDDRLTRIRGAGPPRVEQPTFYDPGEAGGLVDMVVLRSVDTEAGKLNVQKVRPAGEGFEATGALLEVEPWPFVETAYYSPLVMEGTLVEQTNVLPMVKITGKHYVLQIVKMTLIHPAPNYPIIDAVPTPGA